MLEALLFIGAVSTCASGCCAARAAKAGTRLRRLRADEVGASLQAAFRGAEEEEIPPDMTDLLDKLK